jgi:hypothetical protein
MAKIRNPEHVLPNLKEYNWTLALVEICEDTTNPVVPGPVPLKIGRIQFTNYQTFVHALINQGEPTPNAFTGKFDTLAGTTVNIL